jgi:preprotein translocase subunit SecA
LYFVIDEKQNSVDLSEKGVELITSSGEDPHFFIIPDVGSAIAQIESAEILDEDKIKSKEQLMIDFTIKSERIHTINQLLKAYCMFDRDVEYIIQEGKIKIVDEQTGRVLDGRRYSDGLHQAIEAKENVKISVREVSEHFCRLHIGLQMYVDAKKDVEKSFSENHTNINEWINKESY